MHEHISLGSTKVPKMQVDPRTGAGCLDRTYYQESGQLKLLGKTLRLSSGLRWGRARARWKLEKERDEEKKMEKVNVDGNGKVRIKPTRKKEREIEESNHREKRKE